MKRRHHRVFRLLATAAVATGLAAPVSPAVAASPEQSNPLLRNDIAHFGNGYATAERPNPILRNDIAHFGTGSRLPAPTTAPAAVVVRVHGGFDWISAGVGLAGGLGLLLAIGVAASAMRARQRTQQAQA